ncbi:Transcriptional activator somA [Colletotrichum chlorophyti]|uniref:Transcriptional activator somA n=1 Tax=Colletotrichum chlorophyti TaxID=708187 RepID=A0A1Q8R9Y5_9PEZI|nr:Transcriptional activator somA [Colletotrichum chlorophyti]
MNVNVNPNLANMNAMGGPVGAPVPMMNNGAVAPQVAGGPRQMPVPTESQRTLLNTYIYEYFLRHQMFDCARSLLNGDHQVNVLKDGPNRRRDENGNLMGNGLGDDPMDTDSKDDIDAKLPDDLPAPKLPMPASESSFLYEWFCLFWDIFHAQRAKGGSGPVNQYVSHTQQQSRMRQNQQQAMLRDMRPENLAAQQQYHSQMMRNMQNGGGMAGMNMNKSNLARTAMANNQNPQAMQMLQQKTNMQRDPSDMDGNRQRPSSPGSGENAPSPSKRPRLDGTPYNPNQPGMMPNGRPQQGMPGQQVGTAPNVAQAQQMLITNGINPAQLTQQQFTTFSNQPPAVQAKSIATYAANLQQHQASQMPNKPMPNAGGPQGPGGSPMMAQGPDLNAYYNTGEMGPGGIRPGPGGAQAGGGSNHALQDYQMQLMLLEQQNKKRLMMARQEQDSMGGAMPRGDGPAGPGGPGGAPGPNGQPFPETSPQGARTGASPNPTEQMKRGTPQMNNAGIPSPMADGATSRNSPNPMNFINPPGMDPNMAPHFFKGMNNMDGGMAANPQMNGGMRPPSSHPGQPFNGQMNPQQMMAARQQQAQQQQAQQQQAQQQPPQQQQPGQGNQPVQWQQSGPNGNQMVPQGPQGQVQGTPQQRSMPPPSAPAGANANRTNTSSPQQAAAAPPTPSQANKAAPKKKDNKATKAKAATQKKSNANLNNSGATPADSGSQDPEPPTPATPITPVNATSFNKNGQNNAVPAIPNGQPAAPAPPAQVAPQTHADANQNGSFGMDNSNTMVDFSSMAFADPLVSDNVLNDFDFDSFLHEDGDNQAFDFNTGSFGMEGANEIGAD